MPSAAEQIKELNYQAGRINLSLKNLQKIIDKRKKYNSLGPEDGRELQNEMNEHISALKKIDAEIRKIENMEIRSRNLRRD